MNCKNCQQQLPDDFSYCKLCGSKVIKNRLTLRNIFSQIKEEFLITDNKLFLTFWHLFIKPQAVISGYINGLRKKYINVIAYAAISISIMGFYVFIFKNFFSEELVGINEINSGLPNAEVAMEMSSKMLDFLGLIIIISTPLSTFASYLIFLGKNVHNYAEHLVINFYITAQTTIISAIFNSIFLVIGGYFIWIGSGIITLASYFYIGFIFSRIYKMSISETIGKTILIVILQFIILGFILGGLALLGGILYAISTN